jgi:SAM-dependent methyltransferase
VLDIACADGYGTNNLFIEGRYVLGVDRAEDLINKASIKYSNCDFIACDIDTQLEKVKGYAPFDAICCFETLEHLKYPRKVLQMFYDIITKDGYLLLSIPDGEYEPLDSDGNIISDYHLHAFIKDDMISMLEECGFKIQGILHQHLSAALHRNYNRVVRDHSITYNEFVDLFPKDKRSLDLLSEVFAWPDRVKGDSYNTIFICTKS